MKPSELIRQRGWSKHSDWRDKNETPCLYWKLDVSYYSAFGAIFTCIHKEIKKGVAATDLEERHNRLKDHLRGLGYNDNDLGIISDWNDAPGRTAEEVIAKLEEFGL